jgi:hypothetical protein
MLNNKTNNERKPEAKTNAELESGVRLSGGLYFTILKERSNYVHK